MAKSPHNAPAAAHIWCQLEGSLGSLIGDTHTGKGLTCDVLQLRWSTLIKSQQKTLEIDLAATLVPWLINWPPEQLPAASRELEKEPPPAPRHPMPRSRWKINISRIIKIPTVAAGRKEAGGGQGVGHMELLRLTNAATCCSMFPFSISTSDCLILILILIPVSVSVSAVAQPAAHLSQQTASRSE